MSWDFFWKHAQSSRLLLFTVKSGKCFTFNFYSNAFGACLKPVWSSDAFVFTCAVGFLRSYFAKSSPASIDQLNEHSEIIKLPKLKKSLRPKRRPELPFKSSCPPAPCNLRSSSVYLSYKPFKGLCITIHWVYTHTHTHTHTHTEGEKKRERDGLSNYV